MKHEFKLGDGMSNTTSTFEERKEIYYMLKERGYGAGTEDFTSSYMFLDMFRGKKFGTCTNRSVKRIYSYGEMKSLILKGEDKGKILGYTLKDEKFRDVVIACLIYWGSNLSIFENSSLNSKAFPLFDSDVEKFRDANLLDLFFEPLYKIGDVVVIKNFTQACEGNGVRNENHICVLQDINGIYLKKVSGCFKYESDFVIKEGEGFKTIKTKHIIRKATKEEKEKFYTKLPTIYGYGGTFNQETYSFQWGCKTFNLAFVLEFLKMNPVEFKIKLKEDQGQYLMVNKAQIKQIKDFVEAKILIKSITPEINE